MNLLFSASQAICTQFEKENNKFPPSEKI